MSQDLNTSDAIHFYLSYYQHTSVKSVHHACALQGSVWTCPSGCHLTRKPSEALCIPRSHNIPVAMVMHTTLHFFSSVHRPPADHLSRLAAQTHHQHILLTFVPTTLNISTSLIICTVLQKSGWRGENASGKQCLISILLKNAHECIYILS